MFGIFDLKYHEAWSKHISRQYMIKNGMTFSLEPVGRDKGCFEKIVKYGKRNVIKQMNSKGANIHGYTLHCTIKKWEGGVRDKQLRRKTGIFYPGFLYRSENLQNYDIYDFTFSPKTTKEQKEVLQRSIQKYHNDNARSCQHPDMKNALGKLHNHIDQSNKEHNITHEDNGAAPEIMEQDDDVWNFDHFPSVNVPKQRGGRMMDKMAYDESQWCSNVDGDKEEDIQNANAVITISEKQQGGRMMDKMVNDESQCSNIHGDKEEDIQNDKAVLTISEGRNQKLHDEHRDHNITINDAKNAKVIADLVEICDRRVQQVHADNSAVIVAGVKDTIIKDTNRNIRNKKKGQRSVLKLSKECKGNIDSTKHAGKSKQGSRPVQKLNKENKGNKDSTKHARKSKHCIQKKVLKHNNHKSNQETQKGARKRSKTGKHIGGNKVQKYKKGSATPVSNLHVELRCPHSNIHKSKDYKNTLSILVIEEDSNYIKEGYYLHGCKCQKCQSKFVKTLTGNRNEVTINRYKKAYRCDKQAAFGCDIVWCHDCYHDQLTKF